MLITHVTHLADEYMSLLLGLSTVSEIPFWRTFMIHSCSTYKDYEKLLKNSEKKPVLLIKHSTACPISAQAWITFQKFAANETEAEFWKVAVIDDRPLSMAIAHESGIGHQSPQVILFYKGKPVWHESHWSIRGKNMAKALKNHYKVNNSE